MQFLEDLEDQGADRVADVRTVMIIVFLCNLNFQRISRFKKNIKSCAFAPLL